MFSHNALKISSDSLSNHSADFINIVSQIFCTNGNLVYLNIPSIKGPSLITILDAANNSSQLEIIGVGESDFGILFDTNKKYHFGIIMRNHVGYNLSMEDITKDIMV